MRLPRINEIDKHRFASFLIQQIALAIDLEVVAVIPEKGDWSLFASFSHCGNDLEHASLFTCHRISPCVSAVVATNRTTSYFSLGFEVSQATAVFVNLENNDAPAVSRLDSEIDVGTLFLIGVLAKIDTGIGIKCESVLQKEM